MKIVMPWRIDDHLLEENKVAGGAGGVNECATEGVTSGMGGGDAEVGAGDVDA
jgi:hypothetical protein